MLPSNAQRNSAPIGSVVQLPFIEHAPEYQQLKHDEIFILSMKKKWFRCTNVSDYGDFYATCCVIATEVNMVHEYGNYLLQLDINNVIPCTNVHIDLRNTYEQNRVAIEMNNGT